MSTNTNIQVKQPTFKVDQIKHLHDHGLAVEFSEPKLAAFINSIKRDGVTVIKAGESKITIHTVGRVTLTSLYLAVGSYKTENVHYYSPDEGLKALVSSRDNEARIQTLKAIMFGTHELPTPFYRGNGAHQDESRKWLKQYGECIHGEHFLRALAIEKEIRNYVGSVNGAEGDLNRLQRDRAKFESRDFVDELKILSENCERERQHRRRSIVERVNALKQIEAALATPESIEAASQVSASWPYTSTLLSLSNTFGAQAARVYVNPVAATESTPAIEGHYRNLVRFPSQSVTYSHRRQDANYTAKINGDDITLSSGIVCSVKVSQLVAWLKGEAQAPATQYGTCEVIEAATSTGAAIKLIKCGCHYIDFSACSNTELAQLTTATHTVERTGGKSAIIAQDDPQAFYAECAASCVQQDETSRSNIRELLENYRTQHKALQTVANSKGEYLAKLDTDIEAATQKVAEAKAALENTKGKFPGATIEDLKKATLAIVNVLIAARFE